MSFGTGVPTGAVGGGAVPAAPPIDGKGGMGGAAPIVQPAQPTD